MFGSSLRRSGGGRAAASLDAGDALRLLRKATLQRVSALSTPAAVFRFVLGYFPPSSSSPSAGDVDLLDAETFSAITSSRLFADLASTLLAEEDADTLALAFSAGGGLVDVAGFAAGAAFSEADVRASVLALRRGAAASLMASKGAGARFLSTLADLALKDSVSGGHSSSPSAAASSSSDTGGTTTLRRPSGSGAGASQGMLSVGDVKAALMELGIPVGVGSGADGLMGGGGADSASSSSSSFARSADCREADARAVHRYLRSVASRPYAVCWCDLVRFVLEVVEDVVARLDPASFASKGPAVMAILARGAAGTNNGGGAFSAPATGRLGSPVASAASSFALAAMSPRGAAAGTGGLLLSPATATAAAAAAAAPAPAAAVTSDGKPPRVPATPAAGGGKSGSATPPDESARSRPRSRHLEDGGAAAGPTSPVSPFSVPAQPVGIVSPAAVRALSPSAPAPAPFAPVSGASSTGGPPVLAVAISRRAAQESGLRDQGYEVVSSSAAVTGGGSPGLDISAGTAVAPVRLWLLRASSSAPPSTVSLKGFESLAVLPPSASRDDRDVYTDEGYAELDVLPGGAVLFGRKNRVADIDRALDNGDGVPLVAGVAFTFLTPASKADELPARGATGLLAPAPLLECFPRQRSVIRAHLLPAEPRAADGGRWVAAGSWTLRPTGGAAAGAASDAGSVSVCLWYREVDVDPQDPAPPTAAVSSAAAVSFAPPPPPTPTAADPRRTSAEVGTSMTPAVAPAAVDDRDRRRGERHHGGSRHRSHGGGGRRSSRHRHHHRSSSGRHGGSRHHHGGRHHRHRRSSSYSSYTSSSSSPSSYSDSSFSSSGDSDDSRSRHYHARGRRGDEEKAAAPAPTPAVAPPAVAIPSTPAPAAAPAGSSAADVVSPAPVLSLPTVTSPSVTAPATPSAAAAAAATAAPTPAAAVPSTPAPAATVAGPTDAATVLRGYVAIDAVRLTELLVPSGMGLPRVRVWVAAASEAASSSPTSPSTVDLGRPGQSAAADGGDRDDEFVFPAAGVTGEYRDTKVRVRGAVAQALARLTALAAPASASRTRRVSVPKAIPQPFREAAARAALVVAVVCGEGDKAAELGRVVFPLADVVDGKLAIAGFHDVRTAGAAAATAAVAATPLTPATKAAGRFVGALRMAALWSQLTPEEAALERAKEAEAAAAAAAAEAAAAAAKAARAGPNARARDLDETLLAVNRTVVKESTPLDPSQMYFAVTDEQEQKGVVPFPAPAPTAGEGAAPVVGKLPVLPSPALTTRQAALIDKLRQEYAAAFAAADASASFSSPASPSPPPLTLPAACADTDVLCTGLIPGRALVRTLARCGVRVDASSADRLARCLLELAGATVLHFSSGGLAVAGAAGEGAAASAGGSPRSRGRSVAAAALSPSRSTGSALWSKALSASASSVQSPAPGGRGGFRPGDQSSLLDTSVGGGGSSGGLLPLSVSLAEHGEAVYLDYLLLADLMGMPAGKGAAAAEAAACVRAMVRHRLRLHAAAARMRRWADPSPSSSSSTTASPLQPVPVSTAATVTLRDVEETALRVCRRYAKDDDHLNASADAEGLASRPLFSLPLVVLGDALEDAGAVCRTKDLGALVAFHSAYLPGKGEMGMGGEGAVDAGTGRDRGRPVDIRGLCEALVAPGDRPAGGRRGGAHAVDSGASLHVADQTPLSASEQRLRDALRASTWFASHLDPEAPFAHAAGTGAGPRITLPAGVLRRTLEERLVVTLDDALLPSVVRRCRLAPTGTASTDPSDPESVSVSAAAFLAAFLDLGDGEYASLAARLRTHAATERQLDLATGSAVAFDERVHAVFETYAGLARASSAPSSGARGSAAPSLSTMPSRLFVRALREAGLPVSQPEDILLARKFRAAGPDAQGSGGAVGSGQQGFPVRYDPFVRLVLSATEPGGAGAGAGAGAAPTAAAAGGRPPTAPPTSRASRPSVAALDPHTVSFLMSMADPSQRVVITDVVRTSLNVSGAGAGSGSGAGAASAYAHNATLDASFRSGAYEPVGSVRHRRSISGGTASGPFAASVTGPPASSSSFATADAVGFPFSTVAAAWAPPHADAALQDELAAGGAEAAAPRELLRLLKNGGAGSPTKSSSSSSRRARGGGAAADEPVVDAAAVEVQAATGTLLPPATGGGVLGAPLPGVTSSVPAEREAAYRATGRFACAVCFYTGNRPYARVCTMCDGDNPFSATVAPPAPRNLADDGLRSPFKGAGRGGGGGGGGDGTGAAASSAPTTTTSTFTTTVSWICPACTFACKPGTEECLMCGTHLRAPFTAADDLIVASGARGAAAAAAASHAGAFADAERRAPGSPFTSPAASIRAAGAASGGGGGGGLTSPAFSLAGAGAQGFGVLAVSPLEVPGGGLGASAATAAGPGSAPGSPRRADAWLLRSPAGAYGGDQSGVAGSGAGAASGAHANASFLSGGGVGGMATGSGIPIAYVGNPWSTRRQRPIGASGMTAFPPSARLSGGGGGGGGGGSLNSSVILAPMQSAGPYGGASGMSGGGGGGPLLSSFGGAAGTYAMTGGGSAGPAQQQQHLLNASHASSAATGPGLSGLDSFVGLAAGSSVAPATPATAPGLTASALGGRGW
jgi:hypothetical protein